MKKPFERRPSVLLAGTFLFSFLLAVGIPNELGRPFSLPVTLGICAALAVPLLLSLFFLFRFRPGGMELMQKPLPSGKWLVLGLADMETGKSVSLPYGMTAQRSYDKIVITRSDEKEPEDDAPVKVKGSIETSIYPYDKNVSISKKEYTKMIDYDKINSALVLRTPGPDDFIVVDGRGGTKKLSRYFTHAKVERNERLSFPVVADGDEIVWIVGLRLSERYKVEDSTKRVMEIRYVSEDIKEI